MEGVRRHAVRSAPCVCSDAPRCIAMKAMHTLLKRQRLRHAQAMTHTLRTVSMVRQVPV